MPKKISKDIQIMKQSNNILTNTKKKMVFYQLLLLKTILYYIEIYIILKYCANHIQGVHIDNIFEILKDYCKILYIATEMFLSHALNTDVSRGWSSLRPSAQKSGGAKITSEI